MKALGIKLAEIILKISENEPVIEIKAKSLKETDISPQLNNIYRIEHNGSYQPIKDTRAIRQKNVNDKVIVNYNHNSSQATMI